MRAGAMEKEHCDRNCRSWVPETLTPEEDSCANHVIYAGDASRGNW